jgi:IstB-like ATP binding protein
MTEPHGPLPEQVVQQQCKPLGLPTVGGQCARLAVAAEREHQPYLDYLAALLAAELEDREQRAIARRLKDAHLPRVKTLEEFDFRKAPTVSPTRLSELAEGGYIERAEPVVFIGDSGVIASISPLRPAIRAVGKPVRPTGTESIDNGSEFTGGTQKYALRLYGMGPSGLQTAIGASNLLLASPTEFKAFCGTVACIARSVGNLTKGDRS